jgi:hypothetical protein
VAGLRSENTKSLPDWVISIPDPTGLQYLTTNPTDNGLPAIATTTCNKSKTSNTNSEKA